MTTPTLYGQHIEKPVTAFIVKFWQKEHFNVFRHPAGERIVKILAETAEGAVKIAQFHFFMSGKNFEVSAYKERRHT